MTKIKLQKIKIKSEYCFNAEAGKDFSRKIPKTIPKRKPQPYRKVGEGGGHGKRGRPREEESVPCPIAPRREASSHFKSNGWVLVCGPLQRLLVRCDLFPLECDGYTRHWCLIYV